MVLTFVLQAVCGASVVMLGQLSGAWFAATLVAGAISPGLCIHRLFPFTSGDYFGTRNATLNYAVLYTAKGVARSLDPASTAPTSKSPAVGRSASTAAPGWHSLRPASLYLRAGSPSVRAKATRSPNRVENSGCCGGHRRLRQELTTRVRRKRSVRSRVAGFDTGLGAHLRRHGDSRGKSASASRLQCPPRAKVCSGSILGEIDRNLTLTTP